MQKISVALVFGSLILISTSWAQTLTRMSKPEILDQVIDKTFTTISTTTLNHHMLDNRFTGYFGKDGQAWGQFSHKPVGDYQSDTGHWTIKPNGDFCCTWTHWSNSKEVCASFYKLNNGVLIITANQDFETMILNKDIRSGSPKK